MPEACGEARGLSLRLKTVRFLGVAYAVLYIAAVNSRFGAAIAVIAQRGSTRKYAFVFLKRRTL